MNRFLLIFILVVSGHLALCAQSISLCNAVLGSAGGYAEKQGKNYSFTVGEVVIATMKTASGDLVLTQGFHQPESCLPLGTEAPGLADRLQLQVFPNPTTDLLTITYAPEFSESLIVRLFNAAGTQVWEPRVLSNSEGSLMSCLDLPSGVFFLEIYSDTAHEKAVFRLVKI